MDVLTLIIDSDPATHKKVVNHRFRLLQTIGQGQFGKVLLAEDVQARKTDRLVAVKTINRVDKTKLITKTYLSHTTKIKREIQIMKECNHPNVVKLYQVIDDMRFDKIFLVLEYCQYGEIDWKRYNHYHEKYFKEKGHGITLNKILRDVINGLEYLHTYKHIIHRDLKPSNLLISKDRSIKISDFGVSLILENNANDDKELGKTMGTPAFYAPELCQFVNNRLLMFNEVDLKQSKIDAKIDLWSLGVVLYCLIFHQLPFEGSNEFTLFKKIVNEKLRFPKTKHSSHVTKEDLKELGLLESLIARLLLKDPKDRPTIREIKADPFTCFDISRAEKDKFESFNKLLIAEQLPLLAETWASEKKFSLKFKKVFGRNTEPAVPPSQLPLTVKLKHSPEKPINIAELEKVDDLLDLYLDDLSSMGLFDEDTEPEVVDTANLLSMLHISPDSQADEATHTQNLPDKCEQHKQLGSVSNPDLYALKKSHLSLLTSLKNSRTSVPAPLHLATLAFYSPPKPATMAPPQLPFSDQKTPLSASSSVTIGAGSPSLIKSMFSPSRRFFSRLKKLPEPTINLLLSPVTQTHSTSSSYTDLAPPPAFGNTKRNSGDLTLSIDTFSRKNSVLSCRSARSVGLSKISSSSSSLNLHAYLTDLESVLPRFLREDSESESEEANKTMTMDEFLDKL